MTWPCRAVQLVSMFLCAGRGRGRGRDDLALQGSAAGEHVLVRRGEGHFVYLYLVLWDLCSATELPDDFFEVTIDDVKLMQSDLKKQMSVTWLTGLTSKCCLSFLPL